MSPTHCHRDKKDIYMTLQRSGHRYRDAETGKTLDVWFPASGEGKRRRSLAEKAGIIQGDFVDVSIESIEQPPMSTEEVYLRLHLSVKPNQINLDGIFGLLPNVAWTSAGPVLPSRVDELRDRLADEYHHLTVTSVDKFPRMTDYVIPDGVRIADADRVRLGAHLASGTTVMHEGFAISTQVHSANRWSKGVSPRV
jgi:2,3,4,5-tetrahydropyridine-2,6-dicarboxylate N-succinyltransferase